VTLFASGDALTKATLVPVCEQAIRLDPAPLKSDVAAHLLMLDQVRRRATQFDIIHFHVDLIQFPMFRAFAPRTVTTLHGRLDVKGLAEAYAHWPQYPLVSISDHQRTPIPVANWAATIHHGLPSELLPLNADAASGYLAFLGRISPEKRPDRAIAIAKATGIPLKIAAKVDGADKAYFHEKIEPLLNDPLVEFIGEINEHQKASFLAGARALLFPIDWPEPFGLVMIEAMACGTPVIAFRSGSVPEVIDEGITGYVVSGEDEAVEAIGRLAELDRQRVRARFEKRFTSGRMAERYLEHYQALAGGWTATDEQVAAAL
jgi:glycosyltransferase involved in cell wall biosynthesis